MKGVALVCAGTLASAAGTRLIARRRPIVGTLLIVGVGSTAQVLSYDYISESTSAAMGGMVTFWTVVLAKRAGERVHRRTWCAVGLVVAGSAAVVVSAPLLHPPTQFPLFTFYVGALACAVMLMRPLAAGGGRGIAPGRVAGFTDTCAKAFVFADGPARAFWGIAALVFASVQMVLLHAALRKHGERAVNPTYMLCVMVSVVVVGYISYGEFDDVGLVHAAWFTMGVALSGVGSYYI